MQNLPRVWNSHSWMTSASASWYWGHNCVIRSESHLDGITWNTFVAIWWFLYVTKHAGAPESAKFQKQVPECNLLKLQSKNHGTLPPCILRFQSTAMRKEEDNKQLWRVTVFVVMTLMSLFQLIHQNLLQRYIDQRRHIIMRACFSAFNIVCLHSYVNYVQLGGAYRYSKIDSSYTKLTRYNRFSY